MSALTDRMRTCAAHLVSKYIACNDDMGPVIRDAADLLLEASNILDIPLPTGRQETIAETRAKLPQGEPMEIIPPSRTSPPVVGTWIAAGDTLPTDKMWRFDTRLKKTSRACPKCDSRAQKTVRRLGDSVMLHCHVCTNEWQYQP